MAEASAAAAPTGELAAAPAAPVEIQNPAAAAISSEAPPSASVGKDKQAGSEETFYNGFSDASVKTWTEAKGFKDAESVAAAAYNLEKLMGFDKAGKTIVMPDKDSTPEQVAAFREKMGVPKTSAEYKLPVPSGMSDEFSKEAGDWFHKAGIPVQAAQEITTAWNEKMATMQKAADEAWNVQSTNEFKEWETKQGAALAQNIELTKRAAAQFIPATDAKERGQILNAMEIAMGTGKFMQFMTSIGAGLKEHAVHGEGTGGLILSPAQAKQRVEELKSNKEWSAKYLNGDKAAAKEMEDLHKLAAIGQE